MKARLLLLCAALLTVTTISAQMVTFYAGILQPATVTVPERVQKIYLATRNYEKSLRTESDVIAFSSLTQLKSLLESTGRYTVELTTTDSASSSLLNWNEVGRLTKYDTTALLIVLEKYQRVQTVVGDENYEQRLWRMYDFTTQSLRDEFDHRYDNPPGTTSNSPAVEMYADRIMMHWEWVQRDYYKGGNARMKAAWHCLDSSDWAGAVVKWKLVARDSLKDPKTAAKACYNMALYCELNGDIAGAQQWIARSQRLGNVLAVYYGRIIRERTGDVSMLSQQVAQKQGQIPLEQFENTVVHSRKSPSKLSTNPNFLERKPPLTATELERERMHNPPSPDPNR